MKYILLFVMTFLSGCITIPEGLIANFAYACENTKPVVVEREKLEKAEKITIRCNGDIIVFYSKKTVKVKKIVEEKSIDSYFVYFSIED